MKKINLIVLFLLGVLVGGLIFKFKDNFNLYNYNNSQNNTGVTTLQQKYSRFEDVLKVLKREYYDQVLLLSGEKSMIDSALAAYVNAIDDPYTVYMDNQQSSGFQQDLKGESDFEGIGAYVMKKDYYVMIEEVLKDSPAFKAGLKPLDRIVMINSGYTEKMSVDEAVDKIRGPKGTKVGLMIERYNRDGKREILEREVMREKLIVPSVVSKVFEKNGRKLGYLEIYMVGEETENIFEREIINLTNQKVEGIILDLRGNGGGFLPIAVEITSHFVPSGKLIVTAKYKTFGDENYYSKGYEDLGSLPTVVLVDGMTASAGEIIAMALQEQKGIQLIGTQTFGKGSIQTIKDFDDGATLKYTIGKRYSPQGKNIDKIGVTPNVIIEFDIEKYQKDGSDNQLEEAKQLLINSLSVGS
ncbi:MAG: S41 family peptidase [Candidatus Absconditicoccaceae bacterium]